MADSNPFDRGSAYCSNIVQQRLFPQPLKGPSKPFLLEHGFPGHGKSASSSAAHSTAMRSIRRLTNGEMIENRTNRLARCCMMRSLRHYRVLTAADQYATVVAMFYRIWADTVLVVHLLFVVFVVFGGLVVIRWPRAAGLHVPAAVWGALIELAGWPCPLTPLEQQLRRWAGQEGYKGGFVDYYLVQLLYPTGMTRSRQIVLGVIVLAINLAVYTWIWRRRVSQTSCQDS